MVYKIKVWDDEKMVFEGYSKTKPKAGENFKAWTITEDGNGTKQTVFSPARYRITYEDTKI